VLLAIWLASPASPQPGAPDTTVQGGAAVSARPFDIQAAVDAYLAKVPPQQRARSDAYFEGGYWLLLWDFLSTMAVMWILLRFRWSARMRDLAERITRFRPLQTAIYWVQFVMLVSIILFPLTAYEGFFREHKYALSNQTFGAWMRDQTIALTVSTVLGAVLVALLFGLRGRVGRIPCVRRLDRTGVHLSPVQQVHQAGRSTH